MNICLYIFLSELYSFTLYSFFQWSILCTFNYCASYEEGCVFLKPHIPWKNSKIKILALILKKIKHNLPYLCKLTTDYPLKISKKTSDIVEIILVIIHFFTLSTYQLKSNAIKALFFQGSLSDSYLLNGPRTEEVFLLFWQVIKFLKMFWIKQFTLN